MLALTRLDRLRPAKENLNEIKLLLKKEIMQLIMLKALMEVSATFPPYPNRS